MDLPAFHNAPNEPQAVFSVALVSSTVPPAMTGVTASFPLEGLQDEALFLALCQGMYQQVRQFYLPLSAEQILAGLDNGGFKRRKLEQ